MKKQKWLDMLMSEEMGILPGQIAFFIVLSLIPIITLITYLGTLFLPSLDNMIDFMNGYLPANVNELLLPIVYTTSFKYSFGLFLLTSFLISSNGINSIIKAADNLYQTVDKHWIYKRIKAIFIMILIVLLIIFMLLVPVFGNKIIDLLESFDLINNLGDKIRFVYHYFKWPITIFYIFFTINLIYVLVPSKKIKSKEVTKGSLFTTFGFILITFLFGLYINSISNYQLFYGSLANIIILMLWIYLLSYIFVFGLMINVRNHNATSSGVKLDKKQENV